MPKKQKQSSDASVADYRFDKKRKSIPEAGIAGQGKDIKPEPVKLEYNPHLPPILRFDSTGWADKLPDLLEKATREKLTPDEAQVLGEALKRHEPWLEWAGKRERTETIVDPVALHLHERVSAQAIVRLAAREDVQRNMFADPELSYQKAVQFYQHDMDWANRLILGDSLQVMASLTKREGLAGQVQTVYMDPPYGIKFASNFQSEVGRRNVSDKENDLTREAEQIKAYRDTWSLGIHSYLTYLRDRFSLVKLLLHDSGSIFVQISDENLHNVRTLLDETFGRENFCGIIAFKKTVGQTTSLLSSVYDYIIWYARDKSKMKFRDIFRVRKESEEESAYPYVEWLDGSYSRLKEGIFNSVDTKVFAAGNTSSQGSSVSTRIPFEFCGKQFFPSGVGAGWKTNFDGLNRLSKANRLLSLGNTLVYRRYLDDFPAVRFNATWDDTVQSTFAVQKLYVVQTANKVIERCILMTTDPGDLVLDPTCGSGTTAYVAEQWGRRWLTIDTSRVALSITRQRLLTATFPMYKTRGEDGANPGDGFLYRTIPHITLKSIAQNLSLDSIFAKYEHILEKNIVALNSALKTVTPEIRSKLEKKLMEKANMEGKRSITDADERRWKIPETSWQEWEVPFDSDPDWPRELRETLTAYRITWRSKMNEVNKAIEDNAELEELVDQPEVAKNVMRVSGPFSVEAVMPAEERLDLELDSDQPNLETFDGDDLAATEPVNAEAYLNKMVRLMRVDGVRFLGNKKLNFDRLEQRSDDYLHAEGESSLEDGFMRRIAVSFGPQYGPVTSVQVENAIRRAARGGFDDLVFAGFSFDATAQAIVQDDANPNIRIHLAHIRPDVMPGMDGLLKNSKNSELFTVFGSPRSSLKALPEGEFEVVMDGVDIYNPVENTVSATNADKVAAWFLDSDYDGRTFCITQAFFPDKSAWEKIGRALKGALDEERLAAFAGKTSLPFKPGKHGRVAVKVIDPRGNEVMRVHSIPAEVRL